MDVRRAGSELHVAPVGELDLGTVDPLDRQLDQVRSDGYERIVLDLSAVKFIDSTGIHRIITWCRYAGGAGIDISLVPGPPPVHRIFELTGLDKRLPFDTASASS